MLNWSWWLTLRGKKKTGFTLIELLVVIAIIAILAAILFPVFAKARENARKTSCASNLKQIGLGIIQYTQDNDETNPPQWQNPPGGSYSWEYSIYPYVKSAALFVCPSNPNKTNIDTYFGVPFVRDYVAQATGDRSPSTPNTAQNLIGRDNTAGAALSAISSPATAIMVYEADNGNNGWVQGVIDDSANSHGQLFSNHLASSNYLFADGHVKSLKPFATVDNATGCGGSGSVNMWTIDPINAPITSGQCGNIKTNLQNSATKYP